MAPGGNFFARILASLLNDVLVKGLANNPAFQRFAVRTSQQMKQMQKSSEDAAKAIANSPTMKQAQKEASQASVDLRNRASEFFEAFKPRK